MRLKRPNFFRFLKAVAIGMSTVIAATTIFCLADSDNLMYLLYSRGNLSGSSLIQQLLGIDKNDKNGNGAGLNLSLIAQMDDCYLKELLEIEKYAAEGDLDEYSYHLPVQYYLGVQMNETGFYAGTKYVLKSYLPCENGKVIWNTAYKGLSAEQMTLKNFTSQEWLTVGDGKELCDWLGEKEVSPGVYDMTPFHIEHKITTKSRWNKSGAADNHYFPDILTYLNASYVSAMNYVGLTDKDVDENLASCIASTAHNRGNAGLYTSGAGLVYTNSTGAVSNYFNDSKLSTNERVEVLNGVANLIKGYQDNTPSGSTYYKLLGSEYGRWMAVAIAYHTDGWYFNQKVLDSVDSTTVEVWQAMYPSDGVSTVVDVRNLLQTKCKTLSQAINEVNGTNLTSLDTSVVYGTQSDYSESYFRNQKSYSGYMYCVTKTQLDAYKYRYPGASDVKPYLVHSYDIICAGHNVQASLMGQSLYATILQMSGVAGVDPSNPSTYLAGQSTPVNAVGEYNYGVTQNDLPDSMKNCGIDVSTLSQIRLKILQNAAVQVANCDYVLGGKQEYTGNGRGKIDCTYFTCVCYKLAGVGYQYMTSSSLHALSKDSSPLYRIPMSELKPGDILACRGHAVMYLGQNGSGFWIAEASSPKTGCIIRTRSLTVCTGNTGDATVKTTGGAKDDRVYICIRSRAVDSVEATETRNYQPATGGINHTQASTADVNSIRNSDVYNKLVAGGFDKKAFAMAYAYSAASKQWGDNVAIGLMANIYAEGNIGQLEYRNSKGYWNACSAEALAIAGKVISSADMARTWMNGTPQNQSGCGVGMIQWSSPGRRNGILSLYLSDAKTWSQDELGTIEVKFMMQELSGSYSSTIRGCSGKSATDCAREFCLTYERPSGKYAKANERAGYAAKIERILKG